MSESHTEEQSPSSEPAPAPEAPAPETPAQEAPAPDAAPAEPSPAPSDAKEAQPSLLDVVKAVVEPKPEPVLEAPSAAAADRSDPAKPAPQEMTEAEIAELPFHNHPRFKEVISQRNALKGELGEAAEKLRQYEPDAQQWGNVREFMQHNNLSDQDVLDGFRMMALLRTDPLQGRAAMAQYLAEVDAALGLRLPDDLLEDVESGYISEERAVELAQMRARTQGFEAQALAQNQLAERTQAEQAQQAISQRMTSAAEAWEASRRSRDPDFEAKADLIADRMRSIAQAERLQPRTPEDITALLDRAHADVTTHLKRFVPATRPINRPTAASPATSAAPAPTTMREAIERAVGG
jgi:hypothetical protein